MNRLILLLAFVAASALAMTVEQSSNNKAFEVGKTFLNTLSRLVSAPGFPSNMKPASVVRALDGFGSIEIRDALTKALVGAPENEEHHLSGRVLAKAFEEFTKDNGLSVQEVLSAIENEPEYKKLAKVLSGPEEFNTPTEKIEAKDTNSAAYKVGQRLIKTLEHIVSEPSFFVGSLRNTNSLDDLVAADPEVREILQKSIVKSSDGENRLDQDKLNAAFSEIMEKAEVSPSDVMEQIKDDQAYIEVEKKLQDMREIYRDEK